MFLGQKHMFLRHKHMFLGQNYMFLPQKHMFVSPVIAPARRPSALGERRGGFDRTWAARCHAQAAHPIRNAMDTPPRRRLPHTFSGLADMLWGILTEVLHLPHLIADVLRRLDDRFASR